MKQLSNRKVREFALALRAQKVSGAFEKRAPALQAQTKKTVHRSKGHTNLCQGDFIWSESLAFVDSVTNITVPLAQL